MTDAQGVGGLGNADRRYLSLPVGDLRAACRVVHAGMVAHPRLKAHIPEVRLQGYDAPLTLCAHEKGPLNGSGDLLGDFVRPGANQGGQAAVSPGSSAASGNQPMQASTAE